MTFLMSRRSFISAAAASVLASVARAEVAETPLRVRADKRDLLFGCAVQQDQLHDLPFMQAVARESNILVHETALKWDDVHPEPDRYHFFDADAIAVFASQRNMKLRGHTLCWYAVNPPWVEAKLAEKADERILTDHIERVMGHYRGRMHSWDVVNEALEPKEGHPEGLRKDSIWQKAFGTRYIEIAFHAARQADPNALLFYNDYFLEMDSAEHSARRAALLRLCETLRRKNVPIDAVGIQSHLQAYRQTYNEKIFAAFLSDIRSLGLKYMITEYDVADIDGPADINKRDAELASLTRRFMDVALDSSSCLGVLTWGLSDRYSWLSDPIWGSDYRWPDGQLSRGLPLDWNLKRKPMWYAIARALGSY